MAMPCPGAASAPPQRANSENSKRAARAVKGIETFRNKIAAKLEQRAGSFMKTVFLSPLPITFRPRAWYVRPSFRGEGSNSGQVLPRQGLVEGSAAMGVR